MCICMGQLYTYTYAHVSYIHIHLCHIYIHMYGNMHNGYKYIFGTHTYSIHIWYIWIYIYISEIYTNTCLLHFGMYYTFGTYIQICMWHKHMERYVTYVHMHQAQKPSFIPRRSSFTSGLGIKLGFWACIYM